MSSPLEAGRLGQLYPVGEPQPFTVEYRSLQYRGEVVLLNRWTIAWGQPLQEDIYFRIVLLRNPTQVPTSDILDSRIAICIPGRGSSRGRGHVVRDLAALRETQALYLTQRDPESAFMHTYLERQRKELEGQLASEEVARYASGHILSPTVLGDDMGQLFAVREPTAWFQSLANALLSWAYPALPLDSSQMPRPLTAEDIPRLHEAMFSSSEEDRAPLGEFGPALGLSTVQATLVLDPGECQVFRRVRAELESWQGELLWKDIHLLLAHAAGLTRPLATCYLFAFAYTGQPETELGLAPDHGLTFRDGRSVRGGRLTQEFIPFLPWRDDLYSEKIVALRLARREVTWNDALQYTSLLCQGLTEIEEGSPDVSKQERELLDALHGLAGDAGRAGEALEALSGTVSSPNKDQVSSALHRLSEVCEGGDFRSVYHLARSTYASPLDAFEDLDLLMRLLHLAESLEDIVDTKAYLDGAVVQSGYRQLSFHRTTLLEEMSLPMLLSSVQGWPTVREHVRDYQARYRGAYADHHGIYQRQVARVCGSLEDSRMKLHALALLNSVPELGEPEGTELEQGYLIIEEGIGRCDVNPQDIPLHSHPRCSRCHMALGETPPTQDLELFLAELDRALGEQNRRLSRVLVDRILHEGTDQRMENFLKIVQASDLSALSNTLNDELAAFIRRLLRNQ